MEQDHLVEFVYREYFSLFVSIGIRSYGLSIDTAKEKIQDTFINVWKNKEFIKNNTEPGVRGYAIRTFRNICINHLRRKSPFVESRQLGPDDNQGKNMHVENHIDENSHPLFQILFIEEKKLQEKAINMLPLKYQDPVRLSLDGFKPRDISEKTGLKMTTLNNYKHRGFHKYEKIINKIDPLRKS